jgi:aminomethyltransferase
MGALAQSPLYERHVALGAKLADFSGWEMPIEYSGVVAEHTAVRTAVGLFDVSHLGKAQVSGSGAVAFLNDCLSNDLNRIGPGQAQYTLCCDDATGGVVDDLIVYQRGPDDALLVPNAANTAEVVRRLAAAAPEGIAVRNAHCDYGVLALQGPRSAEVLAAMGIPADHQYMSYTEAELDGVPLTVCRTGYTGEHGYEMIVPWAQTGAVWDALLAADVVPCGLGARDTLRTEMGYPLHGHELSADITPVQARAGWAVGWKKERFWGREILAAEREAGARRLLWALKATGRGIPRPGMDVVVDGQRIGTVTSGTFSPTLKQGIALALIDTGAGVTEGAEVLVDVRGRMAPMLVGKPPLVESHVR